MTTGTVHAPRLTCGRLRRAASVVTAVALVTSLTACQPPPDRYTFHNETQHDLSFESTRIPVGKTVTVKLDRTPCLDGVVLETDVENVVAVVDTRVCDGDTVVVRPSHLAKDEAHASLANLTGGALVVDLPVFGRQQVEPGRTFEFALFREEGGCGEVAMEVEAREEGFYASHPDPWCDGDTWVIEPADLWLPGGQLLHPGVVTVTNDGAENVTVKASDVDPDSRNGQPAGVVAGATEPLEPPGLQAGRCIRTAVEVRRNGSMSALDGPWRRSDVVELCDGDALRLTADGGLTLVRADGTEVPTGVLVVTTATVLVTNGTDVRIEFGIGPGDTEMMRLEPGDTVDVPLKADIGQCDEVYVRAEVLWSLPLSEAKELCDGDVVLVTTDAITVTEANSGWQP